MLLLSCGASLQAMDSLRAMQTQRFADNLKDQYVQALEHTDLEWFKSHFDLCVKFAIKPESQIWNDMFEIACQNGDVQWLRENEVQLCKGMHMHPQEFQHVLSGLSGEALKQPQQVTLEEQKRAELKAKEEAAKLVKMKEAREVALRYIRRAQTPQAILKEIIELYKLSAKCYGRGNVASDETYIALCDAFRINDLHLMYATIMSLVGAQATECVCSELQILADHLECRIAQEAETAEQAEPAAAYYYGEDIAAMDLETLILTRLPEAVLNGNADMVDMIQNEILTRGNQEHQNLFDALLA